MQANRLHLGSKPEYPQGGSMIQREGVLIFDAPSEFSRDDKVFVRKAQ